MTNKIRFMFSIFAAIVLGCGAGWLDVSRLATGSQIENFGDLPVPEHFEAFGESEIVMTAQGRKIGEKYIGPVRPELVAAWAEQAFPERGWKRISRKNNGQTAILVYQKGHDELALRIAPAPEEDCATAIEYEVNYERREPR